MPRAQKARAVIGNVVKITRQSGGHNYVTGCLYEVTRVNGSSVTGVGTPDGGDEGFLGNSIPMNAYEVVVGATAVTREDRLKEAEKGIKKLEVDVKKTKKDISSLKKFKTDEEEVRHHLLVLVGGDEKKADSTMILATLLGAEDKIADLRK